MEHADPWINLLGVLEQLCLRPISGSFSFGASSSMRTVSMSAQSELVSIAPPNKHFTK
jgi:hypothetical protein